MRTIYRPGHEDSAERIYIGRVESDRTKPPAGKWVVLRDRVNHRKFAGLIPAGFDAMVGPFRTVRAARLMASGEFVGSVNDAERVARGQSRE